MNKSLHARPHLDHLRAQAKSLLAGLPDSDASAHVFIEHLPAARGMTPAQVRQAGFRLADAQSAVARPEGFAGWPGLARHVQLLRALEGTWEFSSLLIDGDAVAPEHYADARLLLDGDRFRMTSGDTVHEGVFTIDADAQPAHIDIAFVAGPESGRTALGLFVLEGAALTLCLGRAGASRPDDFAAPQGSGHILETLRRLDGARPREVTGGQAPSAAARTAPAPVSAAAFAYVADPRYARLEGNWRALEAMRDGQAMPQPMLGKGRRVCTRNETRVSFGGQVTLDAALRIGDGEGVTDIDYLLRDGPDRGAIQLGIMEWLADDEVRFCMAAPGDPRPHDFTCAPGSGRTLSRWRRDA